MHTATTQQWNNSKVIIPLDKSFHQHLVPFGKRCFLLCAQAFICHWMTRNISGQDIYVLGQTIVWASTHFSQTSVYFTQEKRGFQFGLFAAWMVGSWGWLSNTFSMRRLEYWEFIHPKCPYGNLSATCWDVCVLNLSIILSNYLALCLEIREGSVLLSGALSRFDNLKSLYIQGCLPTILPETFQGAVQGEETLSVLQ